MSDYFDQMDHAMRAVVRRRAHLPWYVRLGQKRPFWRLAAPLAALVVAAPAVAAATDWFGLGAPQRLPAQNPGENAGRALPGTSELLGLRVADPQGGPPWGVRLVRTTRADMCIQFGRVQDGRLGSLGIDDAFNNDHRFHPFPNTSIGQVCGTTDAAGNGFVNEAYSGEVANANPTILSGVLTNNCQPPGQWGGHASACPAGSIRIVFTGLLGPDATSITYTAPSGQLKTERTSGRDGAYLLVFPENRATCRLYTFARPCVGTFVPGGASPYANGAIKSVSYRDGHSCHPAAGCPPVGYVASRHKPITAAQVAAPIHVKTITSQTLCQRRYQPNRFTVIACPGAVPPGYRRMQLPYRATLVNISLKARQPATRGSSWYEIAITDGCKRGGTDGLLGLGNIQPGQTLRDQELANQSCKGLYHGAIGYMQHSRPTNQENDIGVPGQDGSVVVGRFNFTIP
jgi:hypothetical protein